MCIFVSKSLLASLTKKYCKALALFNDLCVGVSIVVEVLVSRPLPEELITKLATFLRGLWNLFQELSRPQLHGYYCVKQLFDTCCTSRLFELEDKSPPNNLMIAQIVVLC